MKNPEPICSDKEPWFTQIKLNEGLQQLDILNLCSEANITRKVIRIPCWSDYFTTSAFMLLFLHSVAV